MPEVVAQLEEPHPVLGRHDLAVLVQVGEIRDVGAEPMILALADMAGGLVSLQLAEVQREGKLLLVREVLAVKDEHGVLVHPRIDRRHLLATHRPGDVNPRHLSRELISQRADRYGHLARSFQLQTLHRLTKPLNG